MERWKAAIQRDLWGNYVVSWMTPVASGRFHRGPYRTWNEAADAARRWGAIHKADVQIRDFAFYAKD